MTMLNHNYYIVKSSDLLKKDLYIISNYAIHDILSKIFNNPFNPALVTFIKLDLNHPYKDYKFIKYTDIKSNYDYKISEIQVKKIVSFEDLEIFKKMDFIPFNEVTFNYLFNIIHMDYIK